MAKVKEIYNYIDSIASFNTQEDWDNSGFLVGDGNAEVTKILFTLDITNDVIAQANNIGANLIVSHHPLIFKPASKVMSGSTLHEVIKNEINVISAHTNFDKAVNGINDVLCHTVGLNDFTKIGNTYLNVAEYKTPVPAQVFVNHIKSVLGGTVRYNYINKEIKKVGVCGGSGCDFLELARELGCDAFLTGDASHHNFLDADEMGMVLVAAGHFETENLAIEPLMNMIKDNFDVPCNLAYQETPIITI